MIAPTDDDGPTMGSSDQAIGAPRPTLVPMMHFTLTLPGIPAIPVTSGPRRPEPVPAWVRNYFKVRERILR